jgi:sugar-specific transcriptional regulator TrmB
MPLQKKLEQLNIPEREAQVYLALLKEGMTTVGPIVTATKLHRMMVYQSLERLKDMRMASMVMKNGRQHWNATNPSIIIERLEKQSRIAKDVVEELESLRNKSQDDVHVEIFYGRNGLLNVLESSIISAARTDKIIRIIGGAHDQEFYDLVGDWYPTYLNLLKQNEIKKKLIAPHGYTKLFEEHFKKEPNNEFRLWNSGLSSPTFNRITQEMVSIEVYGKEPILIQIRNKTIAQSYIESFDLLWAQSE